MTTKTGAFILIGSVVPAALALLPFSTALAEEVEGSLEVSAEVIVVCSVTSDGLDFGQYSAITPTDGLAVLTVTCSTPTDGTVSLGLGATPDGDQREMAFNTHRLAYDLYEDSGRNNEFTSAPVTATPGDGGDVTVYGRIPAGQTEAPVGDYTDTVQITFTY